MIEHGLVNSSWLFLTNKFKKYYDILEYLPKYNKTCLLTNSNIFYAILVEKHNRNLNSAIYTTIFH